MLPYFEFTEDVHNFCQFMGHTIDSTVALNTNVCMYGLEGRLTPYIATFHLKVTEHPFIPPDKVPTYLTLMLNGYSYEKAVNEIGVVE